jgi:hypothetical protein
MLILLSEWIAKNKNLQFPHKGIVKDNVDPLKLGGIKVEITGLLESEDATKLPWFYPYNSTFLGMSANAYMLMAVPEIDSEVTIIFPYEDIYFGFYVGSWISPNKPSTFDTDYPNVYGFIDSNGNFFKVNKTSTQVDININGPVVINVTGDITATVTGNISANVSGNSDITTGGNLAAKVGGTTNVDSGGAATVKAPSVKLDAASTLITGSMDSGGGGGGIMRGAFQIIGKLSVTGDIEATGGIKDSRGDLTNHTNDNKPRD